MLIHGDRQTPERYVNPAPHTISSEDRDLTRTSELTLTKILTLTFYLDLDFQSPASYDHDPYIAIRARAKNQGQMSVQKVRLETKGQTDTTDLQYLCC